MRWPIPVALAVTVLVLAGCVPASPPPSPPPAMTPEATAAPESSTSASASAPRTQTWTLAVIGDSNSTGFSGTFDTGMANGTAWAASLPPDRFEVVGGWAVDGSTTARMAAMTPTVPAADIVVILGGTNDIAFSEASDVIAARIEQIGDAVSADHTVIAAVPPLDFRPSDAVALNAALAERATRRGWLFVDPWADARRPDGRWSAPYRTDGVHTSPEGYAAAGRSMAAQMVAALG